MRPALLLVAALALPGGASWAQVAGFDYELGKRLAQRLGIRVDRIVTQGWADHAGATPSSSR